MERGCGAAALDAATLAVERTAEWVKTASLFRGDVAGQGISVSSERPPSDLSQEPHHLPVVEALAQEEDLRQTAPAQANSMITAPVSPANSEIIIDDDGVQEKIRNIDRRVPGQNSVGSAQEPSGEHVTFEAGEEGEDREEAAVVRKGSVKDAVQAVIRACEAILPAAELKNVDKKLSKYVNSMAPQFLNSARLIAYIDKRWALLDAKQKNVYILIRDILDEMRKFRGEGRGGTTSELSDAGHGLHQQLSHTGMPLHGVGKQLEQLTNIEKSTDQPPAEGVKKRAVLLTVARPDAGKTPAGGGEAASVLRSGVVPEDTSGVTLAAAAAADVQSEVASGGGKERTVSHQHIRKLEKALALCGKKNKDLEATEVDFNNEEDDTYILEAK